MSNKLGHDSFSRWAAGAELDFAAYPAKMANTKQKGPSAYIPSISYDMLLLYRLMPPFDCTLSRYASNTTHLY